MNNKGNVILGLVGIFLFFGVLSSFVSPSHSTDTNTANSHEAQLTISPVKARQPLLQGITIQPTATPTPTPTFKPTAPPTLTPVIEK